VRKANNRRCVGSARLWRQRDATSYIDMPIVRAIASRSSAVGLGTVYFLIY